MNLSLGVLRDRNSSRLFFGQLISQSCDKMMTVGLVWVFTQHYSASMIPWFLAFSALPHLLLAPSVGKLTQSWGPLRTIIGTDAVRGAIFISLAAIWPAIERASGPTTQLSMLFGASFAANLASALFNPAILSLPVFLTENQGLQQLTALIDSCFSFGNILGPLLSAALYPWLGLGGLFAFNGLSYFLAAALEAGIRLGNAPEAGAPSSSAGTREAAAPAPARAIIAADRLLAWMLGGFLAINLFLGPITVFLPLFVKSAYHGTIGTLAGLETALGLGTVAGGVLLSTLHLGPKVGPKIIGGMLGVACCYIGFTLSHSPWIGCVFLGALGLALTIVNVFALNLFQTRPLPRDVPVVMSLVNLISVASLPFSMTVTGFLVENWDIRRLALTFGLILLAVASCVALNPELRKQ